MLLPCLFVILLCLHAASTLCLSKYHRPPLSTLSPYTTLFRSPRSQRRIQRRPGRQRRPEHQRPSRGQDRDQRRQDRARRHRDRKSTRLNSSHLGISYAVFCLKKKNKTETHTEIQLKKRRLLSF